MEGRDEQKESERVRERGNGKEVHDVGKRVHTEARWCDISCFMIKMVTQGNSNVPHA